MGENGMCEKVKTGTDSEVGVETVFWVMIGQAGWVGGRLFSVDRWRGGAGGGGQAFVHSKFKHLPLTLITARMPYLLPFYFWCSILFPTAGLLTLLWHSQHEAWHKVNIIYLLSLLPQPSVRSDGT